MHIAFIEDTELYGGTQLWVLDAVDFFLLQGWKITVITPKSGWIAKECQKNYESVNLTTYDYLDITTQTKNYVQLWGNALANSDIAVCTVHPPRDNNFHCSIFAARCIQDMGIRVILVTKTGTIVPSYHRQYYLPDQLANSRVIGITKTIYQYLIQEYYIPEERIIHIYQGIDLNYFEDKKRETSYLNKQLSEGRPIIGCIGSLEDRKGQSYLLKAIEKLKRNHLPNIQVIIVGDGPDEATLKSLVSELNLHSNISFFPFSRDPLKFFLMCDFVVLPSISKEGLPNVILESFSLTIPVIASKIGGVSEIVRNGYTGILVEPRNVEDLVNAILKLWLDQTSRIKMGLNGRKVIVNRHDRKTQMFKFQEFFKSLLRIDDNC